MAKKNTAETVHFTARDVLSTVVDDFNSEKAKRKLTSPELFKVLVDNLRNPPESKAKTKELQDQVMQLEEEKNELQRKIDLIGKSQAAELDKMAKDLRVHFVDRDHLVEILSKYMDPADETMTANKAVQSLVDQYEKLKADHAKTQTELTGSVLLKEDHQFICSLNKVIAHNARACRPFMVEDGLILTRDLKEFPNELANLAIHNFLLQYYKQHIPNG